MKKNEIRTGRISSVNYETGMARVAYTDKGMAVTQEFPVLACGNEYCMPEPGQEVLVAHLSNGSSRGAILGPVWNKKNVPQESGGTLYRKDLSKVPGAAYMRYSDEDGECLLKAGNVHVNGISRAGLDAPTVEIGANLSISMEAGEITQAAAGGMGISAGGEVNISSGAGIMLSDGEYSTSLKEIMERLKALEG